MVNIYALVSQALDETVLGCKSQKIKRDANSSQSVSYIKMPTVATTHADDKPMQNEHQVQVDIWSDYQLSIESLTYKVIDLMRSKGFLLDSIRSDMYEDDVKIVHRPIIFTYLEQLN